MTRGKGKRILTDGERTDILSQKQEAESTLRELEQGKFGAGTGAESIDRGRIRQEIGYLDKVLADGAAPNVRGATKDRLAQEAAILREEFKVNLPTRDEMDHPAKNPGAVEKHMRWLDRNEAKVRRFKEIMRTLEPNDPTATSIEKLRQEK